MLMCDATVDNRFDSAAPSGGSTGCDPDRARRPAGDLRRDEADPVRRDPVERSLTPAPPAAVVAAGVVAAGLVAGVRAGLGLAATAAGLEFIGLSLREPFECMLRPLTVRLWPLRARASGVSVLWMLPLDATDTMMGALPAASVCRRAAAVGCGVPLPRDPRPLPRLRRELWERSHARM